MDEILNIYQMYINNGCRFGFFVKKDSWSGNKYAKVVNIEFVKEGEPIDGKPPCFGGLKYPSGHPKEGKIMGPRMVKLGADWMDENYNEVNGGTWNWIQVYPKNI